MRKTFMDDQFDEWEAYVSGGQPGGKLAAQLMFVCASTPSRQPRQIAHASGDPATAEHELFHMDEATLKELFASAKPLP